MNVKIDSGQIRELQKSFVQLQKSVIQDTKKGVSEVTGDKKTISKDALNLKDIDLENSSITYSQQHIGFNFVFNGITQTDFAVNGFVKRTEKTLEFNFLYSFQKEVVEDGKLVVKDFELNLTMKASFEETISHERKFEKEEILKFIQRIVNEIFETFNDESKSLRAVIIKEDDLKEITKIGKGDLAGLLQSLLSAVFSFVRYKESNNLVIQKKGVILRPERETTEIKKYAIKKIESFTVEIKQELSDRK